MPSEKELERNLQSLKQEWESKQNQESSSQTNQPPSKFLEFNEFIGLPKHPITDKPSPVAPFQIDIFELWLEHNWFIINKSKKIGITEIILRIIAWKCFNQYLPGEVMLVAGNRVDHAQDMMRRFHALFINPEMKKRIVDTKSDTLTLNNGVIIKAYPSNYEAFIGKEKVRCIYLDEAAYTRVNDDENIFENLYANISGTSGDFIITSTPNGPWGFFYKICQQPPNGWYYKEYDYLHGLQAMILAQNVIDSAQTNERLKFDQMYRCKFLAASNAAIPIELTEGDEYEL